MKLRKAITAFIVVAFCLSPIGCGGDKTNDKNPNPSLEYSKDKPPARGGAPTMPKGK